MGYNRGQDIYAKTRKHIVNEMDVKLTFVFLSLAILSFHASNIELGGCTLQPWIYLNVFGDTGTTFSQPGLYVLSGMQCVWISMNHA